MAAGERFNFQNNMSVNQRNGSSVKDRKRNILSEPEEREKEWGGKKK